MLAVLLCRALTDPGARITRGVVLRAVGLCTLYASADEFHQTFEVDRTGSPWDVLVDTLGAAVATATIAWWRSSRRPLERRMGAAADGT